MEAEKIDWYSVEDYLALEERSEVKHEYLAGTIFAMSGASRRHNQIALNVAVRLREQTSGGPCSVYMEGVKARIQSKKAVNFYYPDVMVGCDPDDDHEYYLERPSVVFEVTSPGTDRTDRREKVMGYQLIETLTDYIIVAQERCHVEWYYVSNGLLELKTLDSMDQTIEFPSIGATLTLFEVYEGIAFDDAE